MTGEAAQTCDSVWDALEATPQAAANLRLRSELAIVVQTAIRRWRVTQADAALRLDITQPRLNDLLRGRLDRFSLDALIELAAKAGLKVRIEIIDAAA